ncbi:MAG: glycosyltransferase family 4 protein [Nitrospira sp.]|nr:glycosyltransferase family 4 protein [Nitrospira sp.]
MNILVYCDEELGVAGGGSRQVVEFVRALAARGHAVRVVAPKPRAKMDEALALGGVRPVWVRVLRIPVIRPLLYLAGSAVALFRAMWREKPEILLWFDSPGQIAPLWCSRVLGCPYVLFVNGLPAEELTGLWRLAPIRGLVQWALRLSAQQAQAVVSVCQEIPQWMQREWGIEAARCRVIRNGVDPSACVPRDKAEARRRLGLSPDRPYIGFVGGFFPWHGLDTLVEAMALVRREYPTAMLLLVGDGQTKPALEAMVRQRGLEEAVSFVGRVGFEEVSWWIGASDLCVVLHRPVRCYPGDSMKLWEYMACARPVVATAGEGYGDLVEALGAGVSVKNDDAPALAKELCRLIQNPAVASKMGESGRAAVLNAHTWEARAVELEGVFGIIPVEPLRERVCA